MSEVTGVIKELQRLTSSKNGNPTWRVILIGGDVLRTSYDANVAGMLANPEYRDGAVTFTLNERGQITHAAPVS